MSADRAGSAARPKEAAAPLARDAEPGLAMRLWENFGTLAMAILLALGIRAFVIEPYRIPSESMLPTLLVGDHLFVNKFVYGIKIPFTDWRLPGWREPRRGDVIVFTVARDGAGGIYPADERPDLPQDRFVKRIVGLPGDTLEIRGSELFLNGERVPSHQTQEAFRDEESRVLQVGREQLDGHSHRILDDPSRSGPERRPIRIDEGRYFVMGDNRDWSNDSRYWGTVRLAEVKGPAFVLYWSWDWNGGWTALLNPFHWWKLLSERTRWDRLGDPIE